MTRGPQAVVIAGVTVDIRHWTGGERVASIETFADISPIDGSVLGEISRGTSMEAVAAAKAAFPGWAATSRAERARILHAIADAVEKRLENLAIVETCDNGALLRSHRLGVRPRVAHNFRFFADWLLRLDHEDFEPRGHRDTHAGSTLRVKGSETLCPLSAGLVTDWDCHCKALRTYVNGEVVQDGSTDEMQWDMHSLVADIARTITLHPGDVLLSGTPANSRPVRPGDIVEVEVVGLRPPHQPHRHRPDGHPYRRRCPAHRVRRSPVHRPRRRLEVPRHPPAQALSPNHADTRDHQGVTKWI
ncbi:aldehyde dehydrogenase family protein [Streptomyces canus]